MPGVLGGTLGGPRAESLPHLLAQWSLMDAPAEPPSFVEGLGAWLGWADAIPMAAALGAVPTRPLATARPAACFEAADREFQRVRAALLRDIDGDGPVRGRPRAVSTASLPSLAPLPPPDREEDFAIHRQRCLMLQQTMETRIARLRGQVRELVARVSPAMARLAAIDAALADALAPRQQALLLMMPTLLQTHFDRLRLQTTAPPAEDCPPAPIWTEVFEHDRRRLMRAELALRLEPVQGLIEALRPTPSNVP